MKSFFSFVFLMAIFLAACQSPNQKLIAEAPLISESYEDGTGRKIKLPSLPEKIISIAPNITEIVFGIGGEDKLVARSQACDYPEDTEFWPAVTTYPSLDMEEVLSHKPDMLLTTDEIFSEDAIAMMEEAGVPVYVQQYKNLNDIYEGIRQMGIVFQKDSVANALADSLQELEKKVSEATANEIKYGTMILISNDPLIVAGGSGFLNTLIEKAGGKNVFGEIGKSYHTTTVEEILSLQPEYLILPSKDDQIYADILVQYPYLQNTPADINKHVFIVNPDEYYRPGPRTLDALLELTHILHSQLNPSVFLDAE